jgi:hypothetical protein
VIRRIPWLAVSVLATLGVLTAHAAPAGQTSREISDGVLRVPLPPGWFGSVGPGTQIASGRAHGVAWILAGNFRFASDCVATHEGTPTLPSGKVLISIGDFVLVRQSLHWPQVSRLHLAQRPIRGRAVSWHVRFAGRAVSLTLQFGSKPNARALQMVNAVLGSVARIR